MPLSHRPKFSILSEVWLDNYNVKHVVKVGDLAEEVLIMADPPRRDAVVRFKRASRIDPKLQAEIEGELLFRYYGLEGLDEEDNG
jgi:hypothetical protein